MKQHNIIGIDLGGTHIKAILVNEDGEISEKMELPTRDACDGTGESWKRSIKYIINTFQKNSDQKLSGVGIAAPGIADENNVVIISMPGRLQGLENFRWSEYLKLEDIPIRVINDAQAALMAESRFGIARGYKHVIMLTLGTGVGGGVLIDGKLYQGHFQRAGHMGHISLDTNGHLGITNMPGSLEEAIGNASLKRRSDGRFESTAELLKKFEDGDEYASEIWMESVRKLAIGICSLINVFAPEVVILGGGISKAGDSLIKPLEKFKELYEWRPGGEVTPIKIASFHDFSGAIGAAGFTLSTL